MLARGMSVDDFAPRLSFNFTAWGKIFEEVAKFRAGRRLYARMMRERFGARDPKSWMFRSLIGGGGSAFVMQEPENNIVRGAYIALAAALSGAQTIALPTYDEAYTIPSAKAQLLALRTMQICAEESGAADTVDPLAGSYYAFDPKVVEAQLARLARLRRERDDRTARTALRRLSDGARGTGNLMEPIMECVKAYATLGEIARAMKDVFGEYKEPLKF